MFKKLVAKMNTSIDYFRGLRNRMFVRTLVLWAIAVGCYLAPMGGEMTFWLHVIQVLSILASIGTMAVTVVITYLEFFVVSKVEAVTMGGKAGIVVDYARDKAVEKIRDIKDEKEKPVNVPKKNAVEENESEVVMEND